MAVLREVQKLFDTIFRAYLAAGSSSLGDGCVALYVDGSLLGELGHAKFGGLIRNTGRMIIGFCWPFGT